MTMTMTPPPPSSAPQIPDTPIHLRSTTTNKFDPKFEDRHNTFLRLAEEMNPYFIGLVPVLTFLNSFLPLLDDQPNGASTAFNEGMFSAVTNVTSKAKMYQPFVNPDIIPYLHETDFFQIEAVSPYLPNLYLVNTSHLNDRAPNSHFPFRCQPDCSIYEHCINHIDVLDLSKIGRAHV